MGDVAVRTVLVDDVMLRRPKTMPTDATVSQAVAALAGGHVHMLLLTRHGRLVGTLVLQDLAAAAGIPGSDPALRLASLRGRTVPPDASVVDAERAMVEGGRRRLAVVDPDGMLLGLMCLKRRGRGFCSAEDVASRSR